MDYFDEEPLSPEIPFEGFPIIQPEDSGESNANGSAAAEDTETPRRPHAKRRRHCRVLDDDTDQSDSDDTDSSVGLSEGINEIKTLVKMLYKKVDKNEKCLRQLQNQSR